MFYDHSSSLQGSILEELKNGPMRTLDLVSRLQKETKATKQGIYRALRVLNKTEIVVTNQKVAQLNLNWVKKINRFGRVAEQNYHTEDLETPHFLNLVDGDSITYRFKNPSLLDAYWCHAIIALMDALPSNDCFIYDPHYWFVLARPDSELPWLETFGEKKRYLLLLVGHKTPLDRLVVDMVKNKYVKYSMLDKPLFKKDNYYMNVVGDYILEAWFDEKVTSQLEDFYTRTEKLSDTDVKKLQSVVNQPGKNKFKISRNKQKAEQLKKKLSKYFYIPK